jgi:hypothetical protein
MRSFRCFETTLHFLLQELSTPRTILWMEMDCVLSESPDGDYYEDNVTLRGLLDTVLPVF